jgi:hypothetical protein
MRLFSINLPILTFLLLCNCQLGSNEKEKAENQTVESEWEVLFDGKSVDHWRGYNRKRFPTKGWRVEDGLLIVEKSGTEEAGFGGDIITKKKYKDFEFELDFMVSDTANSGILYLVKEVKGTPIWHNAPEYQILDNPTYDKMHGDKMDTHRTAENYDLQKAEKDYMKPVGEWNTARIVKKGNHLQHWLNGNLTVEYDINSAEWKALVAESKFSEYPDFAQAKEGHIGLQDHGHRVAFKNIRIKESN